MKPEMKLKIPPKRLRTVLYSLSATLISLLFLLPFFWMASASLRQPGLPPPRSIEWLPSPLAWGNYGRIFQILPLKSYLLNSLFVAGLATPLSLLVASLAGFGMAQLGARLRGVLLTITVGLLMVPVTALWLTRYLLFSWLGITDSYLALIAPALMGSSPLFILLFFWAFRRIPAEVLESARLDGAGAFVIWARIALPQVHATTIAAGMLTFMAYWNDFINPLLYLKSQKLYTLAIGLQQLQQLDNTNWPILMAASAVMVLPSLLLFAALQTFLLSDKRLARLLGKREFPENY
jgi:multiple sugar transport system permease protein